MHTLFNLFSAAVNVRCFLLFLRIFLISIYIRDTRSIILSCFCCDFYNKTSV